MISKHYCYKYLNNCLNYIFLLLFQSIYKHFLLSLIINILIPNNSLSWLLCIYNLLWNQCSYLNHKKNKIHSKFFRIEHAKGDTDVLYWSSHCKLYIYSVKISLQDESQIHLLFLTFMQAFLLYFSKQPNFAN